MFLFFGSAELQPWAILSEETTRSENENEVDTIKMREHTHSTKSYVHSML